MFDTQELRPQVPAEMPGAGAVALPAVEPQPMHVLDRLNAVFKHRRLAFTAFSLVVAGMMVQSYSTIPIYQAWARVQIQDERTTQVGNLNANDPMFWQESEPYYRTQYSIIQSRGLSQRVVRRLNLQANPLFNGAAPPPRDPVSLVRQARVAAGKWARSLVSTPATSAPPAAPDESAQEARLIGAFLAGLQVQPEPNTRLVKIVYSHSDPQFAALAANAVAEEYTQQNIDQRLQNTNKTLKWLGEELKRQEDQLAASEARLTAYREQNKAGSLQDRQNLVVARLNQLNDTATRARNDRLSKEAVYHQLRGADPTSDTIDNFPVIGSNSGVVEAKNALSTLLAQKASFAGRYQPGHPRMLEVSGQIDNAKRQLIAERTKVLENIKNDYYAAVAQERSFSGQLEDQKSAAVDLDRKSGDYNILVRKAESERAVYQTLLQQQKELAVVANSRANNVQVMDRADAPGVPILPNPRKDWITALLAGLTIAIGLSFGLEYLDDTVKTPEDVTKRLRLPLLGLVPAVQADRVPVLNEPVPHDFGEAFRSLRTSLVFTSDAPSTRIIAVTSSQPLEGKTTTACNLAMALALGGSRVLLIDADMRRPGLHKTMGLQNDTGLSHLLVGQARVREAVQRTSESNLVVITAGRTPPNPSELLSSDRMNHFLANLATGPFDWVIIDTPPVLAVTDAVILAQRVSGVVFVVGSEMTRRAHAERALETLRTGRPRSIGVVLNRVDFNRNKYYYSRYYGYQYKSYYGQSQDAA
ncbi:MAG TPA: polysaccharide biosynthesis tyrosine autokinase [Vicinamibacterales bacterium]|nr:polysaccharide biosynthesis tyrosine autokinase [Vicinamibacterales bacterium]